MPRVRGKLFLTNQTFKDTICLCEGLIWYILKMCNQFPDCCITPWFLTSEPCEHGFGFCRTGRYCGRRTNITAAETIHGMNRLNQSLMLDAEGIHFLKDTTAHTRGKTLIPHPKPERLFLGKDTTIKKLKESIADGMAIGRAKFQKYTNFTGVVDQDEDDYYQLESDDGGVQVLF